MIITDEYEFELFRSKYRDFVQSYSGDRYPECLAPIIKPKGGYV